MINNLIATIRATKTNNRQLANIKLLELKQELKEQTDQLTTSLYIDEISITKYLDRVERLYNNLKDI